MSQTNSQNVDPVLMRALIEIGDNIKAADAAHPPYASAHEAFAVLQEEVDEVWEEVKKKRPDRDLEKLRSELIDVATVCIRTIRSLGL